jgi:hypothetical protein
MVVGNDVPSVIRLGAMMPRPGQPGAVSFDGNDVTKFLQRWNIECEDFGLTDTQKCERILYYCTDEIKELIEFLEGYATNDWDLLQRELKSIYWQNDTHWDSMASLKTLISNAQAGTMDLNVFIVKYSSMSGTLVERGALSILDRVSWFLDGMSERDGVLEYCSKKDWRLSANDTGKVPSFDELKEYVLTKVRAARMKAVYEKKRVAREAGGLTMR